MIGWLVHTFGISIVGAWFIFFVIVAASIGMGVDFMTSDTPIRQILRGIKSKPIKVLGMLVMLTPLNYLIVFCMLIVLFCMWCFSVITRIVGAGSRLFMHIWHEISE